VGAGPGHPGLITVRGVECLRQADLILYDRLVPVRLLDDAPVTARRICVDELAERHVERCPFVHEVLIEAARQGLRVVRLKGGDPFLFGRGGEEADALRAAGIPYEIVPGVTAALGAGAFAGIPLTQRQYASAVALVTGHEQPDKGASLLDWSALARFPGTLVFYMGMSRLEQISRTLIEHGKPADTPAAAVQRATTLRQRTVTSTLADLPAAVRARQLEAPAVVLVGSVVALRQHLAWFEDRPLFGKRVLVTRPKHQAGDLVRQLEDQGAEASVLPVVEIREAPDLAAVDRSLAELSRFQWLVFTSSNGVHAYLQRLRQTGRDLRALGHLRLAVIGPATGEALRGYHLEPDVMPDSFNSEGLVATLLERVRGQRVLLARADRGIPLLRDELARVAEVEQVAVYSQVDGVLDPEAEGLRLLREGQIDFITLTSSQIARALIEALDDASRQRILAGEVGLATISPRTSEAVRERGLPVAAEAHEYTTAGVVAALCELLQGVAAPGRSASEGAARG
jgi:uroporphyrinogen III methyltransferase/synthase